ncbi:TonB-dependent receptor [Mangrovimicrobium sediminis]|uniref:TonB-dependent receptor n=1 Tax=Mangrovimicrobium sediminis TaxID=2562682 RepID=A0A4Z0M1V4_9GAMM|nr:TonB-dependent receptor [Haliea sp. SAOS-164]TGD73417.1 TonB-dependent receptor [Haliea sp. SAOS-164]
MKPWYYTTLLYASTAALSAGLAPNTFAQGDSSGRANAMTLEEVIVTARRREEFIQDVPVSLTVFNQKQLDAANITNPGELATYTPNLSANARFGGDNTTFAIRGFSQELRTTASVGVYFAEVVALRGANSQQSGDGATPGDLFDLENVQVLKGPTGTLFGRNTTGGAVLLTPKRPTDEFEGYVEGSVGNYDMLRGQAVLNVPITDSFKMRFGIDHSERDGYLDNISGIGPDNFADQDYTAYRVSALWEITDSLENYTIVRGSESSNNGYPASLIDCNPEQPLGLIFCQADLDNRRATGNDGFYDVYSFVPNPVNEQDMWQAINTTTWEITDDLLVKNILAFGALETKQRSSIYGSDWRFGGEQFIFQQVGLANNFPTTDQETFVWELQLQGSGLDDTLTWQAGLYYEDSEPGGDYGAQSPALIICDQSTITGDPENFQCNNPLGAGAVQSVPGGVEYTNMAIYGQATYEFTDTLALTVGLRYTDDETKGYTNETIYYFPSVPPGQLSGYVDTLVETRTPESSSDEPTWMIDLDYKPTDDLLVYGKYSKGYRQGSVNIGGSSGLDVHGPETVDTFEIGSKSSFYGAMPATLNVAVFYNDFQDQQVQYGYFKPTGVGTTAIVNAGSSTIYGAEIEATLQLTENLILNASYAYLDSEVDELIFPDFPPNAVATEPTTTTAEGEPLSFAPEHTAVITGVWLLPFDAEWGDMKLSATYVYTDEQQAVSEESSIYATLDSYDLWNFNYSWEGIFGTGVDLAAFVTNATDEEYVTYVTGNWNSGFEFGQVGMPRMYGARIRYNFGVN